MSWEKNVRKVVPYTPGDQPKVEGRIIKLNTNECPYPPTPKVREALDNLPIDSMRLYPNPSAAPLVKSLAKYYGVNEDEVFVGVGSDDVLADCFLTFFNSEKPILFPDITYSFYDVWAEVYRIPYKTIPLDDKFSIVKEDYYTENGGIVLANPNAPTGEAVDLTVIEDILKHNPDSIVIVDEAYADFGGVSALPLINKYDNLLVVQTFSKSRAFAGMRIGYAIGNKILIKYLNDVKFSINSYTMNQTAIACGVAVCEDTDYFDELVSKVVNTRENAKKEFVKLGFKFQDSKTNFVFVTHDTINAKDLYEYLKSKNIYVRYFNKPRINNHLRITIGTDEEMNILFEEIRNYMKCE